MRFSDFADRLDIDAVYAGLDWEPIDSRGGEDRGYCFDVWDLHKNGDTTGKLHINRDKKVFNCWVCGGGSLLALVGQIFNIDGDAAANWLKQFATTREKSDAEFLDEIQAKLDKMKRRHEMKPMPYFNEQVLLPWRQGEPTYAHLYWQWCRDKHIDLEVAKKYIAFNSHAIKHPPRDKKTREALFEHYVGPALVFPHYWKGKLVGWQHRWPDDRPEWVRKYSNTPDFPRSETLWGVDHLSKATHFPVVVVESVPTAIRVSQVGFPCVATFGADVSDDQLRFLRRFQTGLIIAPDNDKPGIEGLCKMVDYLDGFIPLKYVEPVGDPGSGNDLGDLDHDGLIEDLLHSPRWV